MDDSNKHLLFIGCYRDDEMDADHHVSVQLDKMRKADVLVTRIGLGNMDENALSSYVSERLCLPRRLTTSISEIVHRKSLGNPFFATEFLQVSQVNLENNSDIALYLLPKVYLVHFSIHTDPR